MIIFYQEEKQHLIVTPFRCGSQYLRINSPNLKLQVSAVPSLDGFPLYIEHDEFFKKIRKEALRKTFLFREPHERFLSYFNSVIIEPKDREWFFWELAHEYLMGNQNIFVDNWHTVPQINYFKNTQENIDEYDIISVKDYAKFIYLNFDQEVPSHTNMLKQKPIRGTDLAYALEIFDYLRKVYECETPLKNKIMRIPR
jgi:hypothetical protein